jgi:hypothetical protein
MEQGNIADVVNSYYFLHQNVFDTNAMLIESVPIVVTKY